MAEGPESVVIVGGGLAGAKTAEALREQGYDGSITLLAAEEELPYERPPLSKGYLAGKDEFEKAVVHPLEWYAEHDVDLRRGAEVSRIDRGSHEVELADGTRLPYGALVLATGSEPRTLDVPGAQPLTLGSQPPNRASTEPSTPKSTRTTSFTSSSSEGMQVPVVTT